MKQVEFAGNRLRQCREERGLTQQDVFAQIHVPVQYIVALERGQLADLPAPAYTVGFLASYCEFLELDAEPFVDQLHACLGREAAPAAHPRASWRASWVEKGRPPWLADLATWGAICVVLLLAWFTYMAIVQPFVEERRTRVEADTPAPPRLEFFDENF